MPKGIPKAGARQSGAGRKPKNHVSKVVHMPENIWQAIDDNRGTTPRGEFIAHAMSLYLCTEPGIGPIKPEH